MDDVDSIIRVPLRRAAQIIGVTRTRLVNWGKVGILRPRSDIDLGAQHRWLYSIDELAAGRIIRSIENAGVNIHHLSWLLTRYRDAEHTQPLISYRWAVDPAAKRAYLSDDGGESWLDGSSTRHLNQYVMKEILDLEQIRTAVRQEATKRRGRAGRTVRERGRLRSKEVFAGTRVPVDAVRSWIESGFPDERILEAYPAIEYDDIAAVRREMQRTG